MNKHAADYTPTVRLTNSKLHNVNFDAFAYLFTPPNEWSVVDDCGEFPCTGPLNALIKFEGATFTGTVLPANTAPNFQIIAANTENSEKFVTCTRVDSWNGYYCNNENLAVITFESLDEDKYRRILSPITITNS